MKDDVKIDALCPQATILIMSAVSKPALAKLAVMLSRSCCGSGTPKGPVHTHDYHQIWHNASQCNATNQLPSHRFFLPEGV